MQLAVGYIAIFIFVLIGLLIGAALVAYNFLQYRFKNDKSVVFILIMICLILISVVFTLFCAGLSKQSSTNPTPSTDTF